MEGPALKFKTGVTALGLDQRILDVLPPIAGIYLEHGQTLVVTSTTEGKHGLKSFHYAGLAVDLRTRYFSNVTAALIASRLRSELRRLDSRFDVVFEPQVKDENGKVTKGGHIHVELDIRKRLERPRDWGRGIGSVGPDMVWRPPFVDPEGGEAGESEGGS